MCRPLCRIYQRLQPRSIQSVRAAALSPVTIDARNAPPELEPPGGAPPSSLGSSAPHEDRGGAPAPHGSFDCRPASSCFWYAARVVMKASSKFFCFRGGPPCCSRADERIKRLRWELPTRGSLPGLLHPPATSSREIAVMGSPLRRSPAPPPPPLPSCPRSILRVGIVELRPVAALTSAHRRRRQHVN